MSKISPPPSYDLIADPVTGKATRSYQEFFDDVYRGDQGQSWTPTFVGLTTVGTPTITGTFYQFGALCYFRVIIIPGTSTSSTYGTTYINNFPLTLTASTGVYAATGSPTIAIGSTDAGTNRIYTPSWSVITIPITLTGTFPAS